MTESSAAGEVLDFWFGDAIEQSEAGLQKAFRRWFAGGKAFDEEVRARFLSRVERAMKGGLDEWADDIRDRVALILLLDQFPRNIFRRSAEAFAGDARALELARQSVESGEYAELKPVERVFLLMPYQHSEDVEVQEESVRLFERLLDDDHPAPLQALLESSLDYARRHRDIVVRFGRFPYRNEVLERETTPEEARWLNESTERFGQ